MNELADQQLAKDVKSGSGWYIALGILVVILGVFAINAPFVTGIAVQFLVGAMLLVGGIAQVVHGIQNRDYRRWFWVVVGGLLSVVCAIVMFVHPMLGLSSLTLVLIVFFLVTGVAKVVFAFRSRPEKGWGWLLFSGIITLLLGFLIWRQWPLSGAWAVGVLVGVGLIFDGMAMIFTGGVVRSIAKAAEEDAGTVAS